MADLHSRLSHPGQHVCRLDLQEVCGLRRRSEQRSEGEASATVLTGAGRAGSGQHGRPSNACRESCT